MRTTRSAIGIAVLTASLFGCVPADGEAENGGGDGTFARVVAGARAMLRGEDSPVAEEEAPEQRAADSNEAIVRCEVRGEVLYTYESQCDNAGGHSARVALKGKNSR